MSSLGACDRVGRKNALMLSVVGAVVLASPAWGQSAQSPDRAKTNSPSIDTNSASGIEDIVVTARKVEESQQTVPVAITAFSQAALDERGIKRPIDLAQSTPGLQITSAPSQQGAYSIRGQGQGFNAPPGVLTYFAGAPITGLSYSGGQFGLFDLQSVQVLKGPQGTLFGRTATGGAVLFEPQRPTNKFEGFIGTQLGARHLREITGALNLPIIDDVLAVRVAAQITRQDGYTRSFSTGQRLDNRYFNNFRVGLKFTPADWFENYTVFQYNETHSNVSQIAVRGSNPAIYNPANYAATLTAVCGGSAALAGAQGNAAFIAGCIAQRRAILTGIQNSINASVARAQAGDIRVVGTSAIVDNYNKTAGIINQTTLRAPDFWAVTNLQLKNVLNLPSLSSSRVSNYEADGLDVKAADFYEAVAIGAGSCITSGPQIGVCTGGAITNNPVNQKPDTDFSNEVNVSATLFDRLDLLSGYFYSKTKFNHALPFQTFVSFGNIFSPTLTSTPTVNFLNSNTSEKGFFIQGTLGLKGVIDGLRLTGGYRWNSNRDRVLTPAGPTDTGTVKGFNYTMSADYEATRGLLIYARHSRAYKPGGVNLQCGIAGNTTCPKTFGAEVVKDYEAGVKWDWRSGELQGRTNIAAFLLKDGDIQRRFAGSTAAATSFNYILNPAQAKTKGVEIEQTLVYRRLDVGIRASYMDAGYTKWPAQAPGFPCFPTNNSANNCADYSSSTVPRTPEYQINVAAGYTFSIGDAGDVRPWINFYRQGAVNYADVPLEDVGQIGPAYSKWDARVDWNNVGGRPLRLSAFVRNLSDKVYTSGGGGVAALGVQALSYAEPRTWGIELLYRFGN